jgi:hypothetical protein
MTSRCKNNVTYETRSCDSETQLVLARKQCALFVVVPNNLVAMSKIVFLAKAFKNVVRPGSRAKHVATQVYPKKAFDVTNEPPSKSETAADLPPHDIAVCDDIPKANDFKWNSLGKIACCIIDH